jgi:hypothetical protein
LIKKQPKQLAAGQRGTFVFSNSVLSFFSTPLNLKGNIENCFEYIAETSETVGAAGTY